jgi:hypothetical protein
MTTQVLFETVRDTLVGFGGGVVLVVCLSNFLGKLWASRALQNIKNEHNRAIVDFKSESTTTLEILKSGFQKELESYRTKLSKSEFIFEKEYEATSELCTLIHGIVPDRDWPDEDWNEACEKIAHDFSDIGKRLKCFLSKHSAILSTRARCLVENAHQLTLDGIFNIGDGMNGVDEAKELMKKLWDAETLMISNVRSQSST